VRPPPNGNKHFSSSSITSSSFAYLIGCITLIISSVAPRSVHSFTSHHNNNYDRSSVLFSVFSPLSSLSNSNSNSKRQNNHHIKLGSSWGGFCSPICDSNSIGHRKSTTAIFSQPVTTDDDNGDDDGNVDVITASGSSVKEEKKKKGEEGFDPVGFAGYLAPYVATLLLSIVVTGAFFKFVMMDY